jgi:hypothetical protein
LKGFFPFIMQVTFRLLVYLVAPLMLLTGCAPAARKLSFPAALSAQPHHYGSAFYRQAAGYNWHQRDSLALDWAFSGNIPSFLLHFRKVEVSIWDSVKGKKIKAWYYVSPDYFSVGNNKDWARVPLTPMAAQKIADSLHCFLPTRKMADDIYAGAAVRPEPMPMYALRDSTPTMWHHHLIIEGQRKGQKGLIAGIKKDVVISGKVSRDGRANRVAIYGWHQPGGRPVQPLYTGHVNWYVDYSHGIRLVHETIFVEGKPMHYTTVLQHPVFSRLLCNEEWCDMYRY